VNIQVLSDLHFEFYPDMGLEFVKSLDPDGVDLLVVAGDNHVSGGIGISLELLCTRYPRVLYVPGNHDFYSSSFSRVRATLRDTAAACPRLTVLDNTTVDIDIGGYKFAGTPLWFRWTYQCATLRDHIADFSEISNFTHEVEDDNRRAIAFLDDVVDDKTIVVTHHLPARQSIAPYFKNSMTNCFFLCDMEKLIADRQPMFWIHGHTHSSCDYTMGNTRVVCNPFGYYGHTVNDRFNPKLIIKLP